jgi:DNA invertase Pin-like site-specific DNA recombinase
MQPAPHGRKRGRRQRRVDADQIYEMRKAGLNFREIARRAGIGYGTAWRTYHRAQGGNLDPKLRIPPAEPDEGRT